MFCETDKQTDPNLLTPNSTDMEQLRATLQKLFVFSKEIFHLPLPCSTLRLHVLLW